MGAKELWKASALPRVKFFLWLALHGRLWTAERRRRHGLQDGDACTLCGQLPETTDHLMLSYAYAREVWWRALQQLHLQHLAPTLDDNLKQWWFRSRAAVPNALSRSFDSFVLLVA
jgi:hypothetical protein